MEESFLHFIWQSGKFNHQNLQTTDGVPIQIIKRGTLNNDSGPDFFNGRIVIDNADWTGNIEIHIHASDWLKHNHTQDPAYQNTILHVVLHHDCDIALANGSILPCLELKNRIPSEMLANYQVLKTSISSIPCAPLQPAESGSASITALHRALVDRLILKAEIFLKLASEYKNDWETVFFIALARYLGNRVNDDSMEQLARSIPRNALIRMTDNPGQVEALLFGQAGMLASKPADEYQAKLKKEYNFLRKKLQLTPMSAANWKFMRMRPAGFPTVRIAQLAALIESKAHIFSKILLETEPNQLVKLFSVCASEYWNHHYRFGTLSVERPKNTGSSTLNGLLINAVAPVLFAYGVHKDSEILKEKAFDLLAAVEPESNKITREWESLGFENKSAYESQAFIGMRKLYCDNRRCTECAIGQKVIRG